MKNGKRHGFGRFTSTDGKIYEGEYVNDKREGKGKIIFPDGKILEGNFVGGELNGEVLYSKNNKIIRKALYSKGQFIKYLN